MIPLRLRVEPHDGAPFERALASGPAMVGRAPTADILLTDALVSRQHARFSRRSDAWWIEDLGARNRTFLNDREITAPAPLHPGDVVRIGSTIFRVLDERGVTCDVEVTPSSRPDPVFVKTSIPLPSHPSAGLDSGAGGQTARVHMLNEVHRALATPISLGDLLDLILERCFAVFRPEQGVILLRNASGELKRAASRRLPAATEDLAVSRRIVEEVADKGQSALVLDAALDERFAHSESIASSGIRSVVAAPLIDADGTLGMIALFSRVSVRRFSQQDLDLLESLASAAALRVRNVALAEEAAARRVLDHELTLAHDIQMSMLPRAMPEHPDLELAAILRPARSVGGDLYDVVSDRGRVWLIVADVSGKGVAAALYMAVAKTLFRAIVPGAASLAEVASRINHELCRDNDQDMFVTALLGCIEPGNGTVTLCDAGHNPPVLLRREGVAYRPTLSKGIAFGVVPDAAYVETPVRLQPGDMLVVYTDGITEARSTSGQQFELTRVERSLEGRVGEPIHEIIDGLVRDVAQFTSGVPPEDDLAVLALRYRGVESSQPA